MQGAIVVIHLISILITGDLWFGRTGTVHFVSDAPLEMIKASTTQVEGFIKLSDNSFAFRLETGSFRGFNNPLQQEHFHENYMESEQFPTATFSGKFIENIRSLAPGDNMVRAKGKLQIHGVSVERIIKCRMQVKEDEIELSSDFTVPLAEHNIRIPQVVHQKIAEEIKVSVQIDLSPR